MKRQYAPIAYASMIALATILAGTLVASLLGMGKAAIKDQLLTQSLHHQPTEAAAHRNTETTLRFLHRTHTHAQGLGATALAVSVLLAHTAFKPIFQRIFALGISLGAMLYSFCLLYVGVMGGAKGVPAALADMHYLAMTSVALYGTMIGVLITVLACYHLSLRRPVAFFFTDRVVATSMESHPSQATAILNRINASPSVVESG